jgi:HK97 family phage major capsid protein
MENSISDLVASIELEIEAADMQVKRILDSASERGQANLSVEDSKRCDELLSQMKSAKRRMASARAIQEQEARDQAAMQTVTKTAAATRSVNAKYDEVMRISSEPRTYHRGNDPRGVNFLRDVARSTVMGDPTAQQRLARHMQEERVERPGYEERAAGDLNSAAVGGVVVPQYLVDQTALAAASRRPFADACTKHPLPAEGMSLTVPVFTTPTSVTLQANQFDTVGAQSMVESDLVLAVKTAAGYQNVSRQAVDRSRIDEFVMQDLLLRYAGALDSELLNGATTGLTNKALATLGAFADTQPTGAKLYPKILASASGVEAVVLGANADLAVMHSRRWNWLSKEMTSTWPLINSQGIPEHAGGVNTNRDYGAGVRGVLPNGLLVIVDNNISTTVSANQDEIYVVPSEEAHLWEDPNAPVYIRAEQPNAAKLGILFVAFGYFAYTFDRYGSGSMQKVSGTGLTTPTW